MVSIRRSDITEAREGVRRFARPWDRTGQIDVEHLAAWAYGAQMVERFERVGLHAIEAAAAGYEVSGYSTDGVGQLMQIQHLGCRIDRGGVLISDVVHPAAYAVAAELAKCDDAGIVRAHARTGTRPNAWVPPVHRVRPAVWSKEGREAQVEYQGPGRKGGYCSVIIVWDRSREAWGRADYGRWHGALEELAWRLSMRALGFAVTGPEAPGEPWSIDPNSAAARRVSLDESVEAGGAPAPPRGSSGASQL